MVLLPCWLFDISICFNGAEVKDNLILIQWNMAQSFILFVILMLHEVSEISCLTDEELCNKEIHHQPQQVISRAVTSTMPQGDLLLQLYTVYREVRMLHLPCKMVPPSNTCHNETHRALCGSLNFYFISSELTCKYRIQVSHHYYVMLMFLHFDLEMMHPKLKHADCSYNNLLRIEDNQGAVLVDLCGSLKPFRHIYPFNIIALEFLLIYPQNSVNITMTHEAAWHSRNIRFYKEMFVQNEIDQSLN